MMYRYLDLKRVPSSDSLKTLRAQLHTEVKMLLYFDMESYRIPATARDQHKPNFAVKIKFEKSLNEHQLLMARLILSEYDTGPAAGDYGVESAD